MNRKEERRKDILVKRAQMAVWIEFSLCQSCLSIPDRVYHSNQPCSNPPLDSRNERRMELEVPTTKIKTKTMCLPKSRTPRLAETNHEMGALWSYPSALVTFWIAKPKLKSSPSVHLGQWLPPSFPRFHFSKRPSHTSTFRNYPQGESTKLKKKYRIPHPHIKAKIFLLRFTNRQVALKRWH